MEKLSQMEYNGKKINLVEIWECEFNRQCKEDLELQEFLEYFDVKEPLNVRNSFFGGRCEPFKLYHECSENEKIKYYDITSLYPYVQKYKKYPIGHPEIILKDFKNIEEYFGFVKLAIVPPRKLLIPVLPIKAKGKLLFALCQTCANENIEICNHSDIDRAIYGTYCTEEVKVAVQEGYKIQKIYEIWHWNETSDNLFSEYIDTFLKGKQESSGYPNHVVTEEDKINYIQEYYKNEGIYLDKEKIQYNAGMRAVLKLLLNSFWGKFGEQENKIMYKIVSEMSEWISLISDEQIKVVRADYTNDKYLQVYYKNNTEITETASKTNVALASFVTCYGRLKLFSEIKQLGQRLIYCDTVFIFFNILLFTIFIINKFYF
jgi:hypothetical protein